MIAMSVAAGVVVVGAIALAVMTRDVGEPLKPSVVASDARRSTSSATWSNSTASSSRDSLDDASSGSSVADVDVATPGNSPITGSGSDGEQLQQLASEFAQHHWANAIAECLNHAVAIAGAKQCAISACELHDTVHAQMYYAYVTPEQRGDVQAACAEKHIPVERHRAFGPHRPPIRSPRHPASPAGSDG
jgi:hypothetical protein